MQIHNLKRSKYLFPFVKQNNTMSCGPAALATVFKYYGFDNIQPVLEQKAKQNESGTSLYNLSELAKEFGFSSKGLAIKKKLLSEDNSELKELNLPFIAHIENSHFVVVYKINNNRVFISDPAVGKYEFEIEAFLQTWNGVFLNIEPDENYSSQSQQYLKEVQLKYKKKKSRIFNKYFKPYLLKVNNDLKKLLMLSLIQQSLLLVTPVLLKYIFDHGVSSIGLVVSVSVLLFSTYALLAVIYYYKNNLFLIVKTNFEYDYFSKFFDHILNMKQIYYDRYKKEDFIFRYHENIKVRNYINSRLTNSLFNVSFTLIYLFVIFYIHLWSGIVAIILLTINILFLAVLSPLLLNNTRLNFHENNKILGSFLDKILGIYNLKILNSQKAAYQEWQTQYQKTLNKILGSYFELNTYKATLNFISSSSKIAVVCFTLYMLSKSLMTFGDFIAVNSIFIIAMRSIQELNYVVTRSINISFSLNRISDFFFKERDLPKQKKSTISKFHNLTLKDVSFSYDGDENVLNTVSLSIKDGRHYGLVGRNGTGKTTLAKLLSGFYDSYRGSIKINDKELRDIPKNELRDIIFLFPNEVYIYDTTIRENLLLANKEATDEQLREAIELADLDRFIDSLYLGLNQRIGDRGMNLSSGEQLKIGFARLFLKNPSLIILDEATSSLDPETENRIIKNTYRRFSSSTIISIAHRIHTLKKIDEIIVLDEGEVAEKGNHEELYEKGNTYYEFVNNYIEY